VVVSCKDLEWLDGLHSLRSIGDGKVQQLNIFEYYEFGKRTQSILEQLGKIDKPVLKGSIAFRLFSYRWMLKGLLQEPCALLPGCQRSLRSVIKRITDVIPSDEIEEIVEPKDKDEQIQNYQLSWIAEEIKKFETILRNDMPEMATFAVSQIGIFRTDDLINNAHRQIAEPLQHLLQARAKVDITEAGKCLAFRLSTASAFHACRAIEAGIDQYYEALAGKPYQVSPSGGNNNWGAKTEALVKMKADEKVTEFLTHIRKQYRNPVTHPEVVVDEHEAVDLFIASLSAISMMLGATKAIKDKNQPMLKGFQDGWTEGIEAPVGSIRSNNEESPLGLEAGATETT
jgi:hypothetical protein